MRSLLKTVVMVFALAASYALLAEFEPGGWDSTLRVLDVPVVSIRQNEALGWLAIGQTAAGVLVMAQGGAGVVTKCCKPRS